MIQDLGDVTESRLCWPEHKPRSAQRVNSPFQRREAASEEKQIEQELARWRVTRLNLAIEIARKELSA